MKIPIAALSILLLAFAPLGFGPDSAGSVWVGAAAVQAQTEAAAQAEQGLILRRVWTGTEPDFYASSPSPDGRYLTEIDWATGNLAVLDLLSGELRQVTKGGSWTDSLAWAESSVFSPDGSQIAYAWFSPGKVGYEIWAINADGTHPHVLLPQHEDRAYFLIDDWSSDGRHLLVQSVGVEGIELALVSTSDRSMRVLKSLGSEYTSLAAFSPDDRYVAYTHPSRDGSKDSDIFAISVADGREFRLLGGPSDDRLMGWTPDGKSMLFYSDREVTQGIWRLPIGRDLAAGEPELLRADVWRLLPLGFSREAYFYGVPIEQPQVYTGAVDVAAGRFLRSPTPVQDVSAGRSMAGDWSPDGKYLAYVTNDPLTQSWRLVVRPVTGDGTREIPLELRSVRKVRWATDSRTLMIVGTAPELRDALVRVDLATGRLERLLCFTFGLMDLDACSVPTIEGDPRYLEFSPDGRTLYFARGNPIMGEAQIAARDMSSGVEREIAAVRSLFSLSVSPDGHTLAMVDADRSTGVSRLLTVPTAGGEVRELYRADSAGAFEFASGTPWTSDGRHILFISEDGVAWKISSAGGEPQRLVELPGSYDFRHFRLHPDGSRITYDSGELKAEIWMIQNIPGVDQTSGSQEEHR
jgi:Tol biopolymer transport system component